MAEIEEILSLKAVALTLLSKIEAIEKKQVVKPSGLKLKKQSGVDRIYIKKRERILKMQNK